MLREGLASFYELEEPIELSGLPIECTRAVAERVTGELVDAEIEANIARVPALSVGTYTIALFDSRDRLLEEEMTTIGAHRGERPVHGFATSFQDEGLWKTLEWLRALRCTVVQIYDWMESYSHPLGSPIGWHDPSGRPVSFEALQRLTAGIEEMGGVAHGYAPVYAVDLPFATDHPEMLMYQGDGTPQRFLDKIKLANPESEGWQRHFITTYGAAVRAIGFGGLHLDTYGYPRVALDDKGEPINMRSAYESFLAAVRGSDRGLLLSFNQVNGVPSALPLPGGPSFRYCEVWPPNDSWRHLEALLDRSAGLAGFLGPESARAGRSRGTIACYPPVWGGGEPDKDRVVDREGALRTVLCTAAIAISLGASTLLYGDTVAVLSDAYYPQHEHLTESEALIVLAWHRFGLRCRDLFVEGEDTSWYEIGDVNGSVSLSWDGPVAPEPVGGAVFARVVHGSGYIAVSVLDLTGSPNGRWSESTARGGCRGVTLRLLLADPECWTAHAAVLGHEDSRFLPLRTRAVDHRQGRALEVELALVAGWSVLRVTPSRGAESP